VVWEILCEQVGQHDKRKGKAREEKEKVMVLKILYDK
jgi:hypothetical protein